VKFLAVFRSKLKTHLLITAKCLTWFSSSTPEVTAL